MEEVSARSKLELRHSVAAPRQRAALFNLLEKCGSPPKTAAPFHVGKNFQALSLPNGAP
jgi:hypothetical protein